MIYRGTVRNGVVVLPADVHLPGGQDATVQPVEGPEKAETSSANGWLEGYFERNQMRNFTATSSGAASTWLETLTPRTSMIRAARSSVRLWCTRCVRRAKSEIREHLAARPARG